MEENEEKSCNIANNNGDTLVNEQRNYIKKENKEKREELLLFSED